MICVCVCQVIARCAAIGYMMEDGFLAQEMELPCGSLSPFTRNVPVTPSHLGDWEGVNEMWEWAQKAVAGEACSAYWPCYLTMHLKTCLYPLVPKQECCSLIPIKRCQGANDEEWVDASEIQGSLALRNCSDMFTLKRSQCECVCVLGLLGSMGLTETTCSLILLMGSHLKMVILMCHLRSPAPLTLNY